MLHPASHIEVNHYYLPKKNQVVCGDSFISKRNIRENSVIVVLSDGLGSGIKASVLSTLTATMAANFMENHLDIKRASQIIMHTLPVCKVRKIGYSTFTIVSINNEGQARIIEHDNPRFVLVRDGKTVKIKKESFTVKGVNDRDTRIFFSDFAMKDEDRLIVTSDGVSQSGLGQKDFPLGWGEDSVEEYIESIIANERNISARDLAKKIVYKSLINDRHAATDDITCGVIYKRQPRKTLVLTGPPYDGNKDKEIAQMVENFSGKKIIAGGTTASIISRELGRKITMSLSKKLLTDIPPISVMDGVDLVTEGTVTLGRVAKLLEEQTYFDSLSNDGAGKLIHMLLESDIIEFVVGTRINEAHHAPSLPMELEIRRNTVKKIKFLLEQKFLKETSIRYI